MKKQFNLKKQEKTIANARKLVFIGSDGFPVEGISGHPILTFFRRLFLTRDIMRYQTWLTYGGCRIDFNK